MFKYNFYTPTQREVEFVGNLIHMEPNDISYMFFNDNNINYLNIVIINKVKEITFERYGKKIAIDPQQKKILITIMRHVYFKNITNTKPVDEEIIFLNDKVIELIVPTIVSELIHYIRYINDYNRITPFALPENASTRKSNVLAPLY